MSLLSIFSTLSGIPGAVKAGSEIVSLFQSQSVINKLHYKIDEIKPENIMGDRGLTASGFRKDVYLRREEDDELSRWLLDQGGNAPCVIVVTGRYACGKSRMVYEFLCSNDASSHFSKVFSPLSFDSQSLPKEELYGVISKLDKNTLIYFNDIESYLGIVPDDKTKNLFADLFALIHNRRLKCVITISNVSTSYEILKKILASDTAKGQAKSRQIRTITISDIVRNDEVHKWCKANLKEEGFSKVIGGYVQELQRHFETNINAVLENQAAVIYLVSHIILKKYRRKAYKDLEILEKVIDGIAKEERTPVAETELTNALKLLYTHGFISPDWVIVDDSSLYESFYNRCCKSSQPSSLAWKYLADTVEAERRQIRLMIGIDPDDPVYYERCLTKSVFKENESFVTNLLLKHFFHQDADGMPVSIRREVCPANDAREEELFFAVSLIVGRLSENTIPFTDSFINAGVPVNIHLIGELLRAAQHQLHFWDKKDVWRYATTLRKEYNVPRDIYYCIGLEQLDEQYNDQRVSEVVRLYEENKTRVTSEEELDFLQINFERYCTSLLFKAYTDENVAALFNYLEVYPELYLPSKNMVSYVDLLNKRVTRTSLPILLDNIAQRIQSAPLDQVEDKAKKYFYGSAIRICPDLETGYRIYCRITKNEDKDTALILAYSLLEIMPKDKRATLSYRIVQQIISMINLYLISENEAERYGAGTKLFNSLIFNFPHYPYHESFNAACEYFKPESGYEVLITADGLVSLLSLGNRILRNIQHTVDNADESEKGLAKMAKDIFDKVEAIRERLQISMNSRYVLQVYTLARTIRHHYPHADINYFLAKIDPAVSNDNNILLCQQILLEQDAEELYTIARQVSKRMKDGEDCGDCLSHLIIARKQYAPSHEELKEEIDKMIASSLQGHRHKVEDYYQILDFFIDTGQLYSDVPSESLNKTKEYLKSSWNSLVHCWEPLRKENADLLCAVVKSRFFSMKESLVIVNWAGDLYRESPQKYQGLLHPELIGMLAKKLKHMEERRCQDADLKLYLKEIQAFIDKYQDVIDYTLLKSVDQMIYKNIRGIQEARGFENFFLTLPISSLDYTIRHNAWDRMEANNSLQISGIQVVDKIITSFLKSELRNGMKRITDCYPGIKESDRTVDVNVVRNIAKDHADYLIKGLSAYYLRHSQTEENHRALQKLTNTLAPIYRQYAGEKKAWAGYDNFFQAFLDKGLVTGNQKTKWEALARDYGVI